MPMASVMMWTTVLAPWMPGVCNGPGDIYACGCTDIPDGDCDCNGNQLDALGVCGGNCPRMPMPMASVTTSTTAWANSTPVASATVPATSTHAGAPTSPKATATATETNLTSSASAVAGARRMPTATAFATMWTPAWAALKTAAATTTKTAFVTPTRWWAARSPAPQLRSAGHHGQWDLHLFLLRRHQRRRTHSAERLAGLVTVLWLVLLRSG